MRDSTTITAIIKAYQHQHDLLLLICWVLAMGLIIVAGMAVYLNRQHR